MTENLEQELARLEQEYQEKRAALEGKQESGKIKEMPHEKETLREVIVERTVPSVGVQPKVTPPAQAQSDDVPSYERPELRDQVQALVNVFFNKSP